LTKDGQPYNFLNLEIIYGSIPNLIQYSDIDNYIIFHSFIDTPDNDFSPKPKNDKLLRRLADRIGKIEVTSDVVSYIGTVRDSKKIIENKTSSWIFKGPIPVPSSKIKSELESVAKEFENFDEVKRLKKWKSLDDKEKAPLMKSLSTKIGSKVLTSLSSSLFSGKRMTDEKHPKIEGLVTNFKGNLIKITGDFFQQGKKFWQPLDNLETTLKDLSEYILQDVLNVPLKTSKNFMWYKSERSPRKFLLDRGNPKEYRNSDSVFEKVNVSKIQEKIEDTFKLLEKEYGSVSEKNIKKSQVLKALLIGGYKLKQFNKELNTVKNRVQLLKTFAKVMYGLESEDSK
jgi:hypothetical protein